MILKRKLGVLILTSVMVTTAVFWHTHQKPYSTEQVMNSLGDKYDLQSYQIGDTDPVLWIDVYEKNDIPEVEEYLKSKLSKEDMEHYKIEVFSRWS